MAWPVQIVPPGSRAGGNRSTILNALLVNLHASGCGLVHQGALALGAERELLLAGVPGASAARSIRAQVVWRDPGSNQYGARLAIPASETPTVEKLQAALGRAFIVHRTVYLPDTNAEGNVYFARYFEWQGEVREACLRQGISREEYRALVVTKTRLVTVKATMDYTRMLGLFDRVCVRMTTRRIRRASLELVFAVFNLGTGELVAEGLQQLAFQDRHGRLIAVPPPIRRLALQIEDPTADGAATS